MNMDKRRMMRKHLRSCLYTARGEQRPIPMIQSTGSSFTQAFVDKVS